MVTWKLSLAMKYKYFPDREKIVRWVCARHEPSEIKGLLMMARFKMSLYF